MARSSTTFKPGQVGNPAGRPKEVGHIRELARAHTEAAIQALVDGLGSENDRTRVAAAEALLDRGWGRAPQTNVNIEVEPDADLEGRPIDELIDEAKRIAKELAAAKRKPRSGDPTVN